MFCESCGAENANDDLFCLNCGQPLNKTNVNHTSTENNKPKKSHRKFFGMFSMMNIIFCGLGVIFIGACVLIGVIGMVSMVKETPKHVYKMGCSYLEDEVFTSDMEYSFEKFDEDYIRNEKQGERLDFGEGEMTYDHFFLSIPVTVHSDELGNLHWVYNMEIYIHPYGEDDIYEDINYVVCSGQPTWIEDLQNVFDGWGNYETDESNEDWN